MVLRRSIKKQNILMYKKKIVAIILARKYSKRIKNKNKFKVNGKPLIKYTIESVMKSKLINRCYLFSDDKYLKNFCKNKIIFVDRPKKLSGDKISSDLVLLNFFKKFYKNKSEEIIVFLQATSPLRQNNDIDNAIKKFKKNRYDSLFSCYKDKSLFWIKKNKKYLPINYLPFKRKREQEMLKQYVENGSIYVFNKNNFIKSKVRIFGNIGIYIMKRIDSFQLDTYEDLKILKKFCK